MSQGSRKLGLGSLTALVVGSMVGGGIFSLPQNMAASADVGAVLIGWGITAVGMLALAFVFQNLANRKPQLDGGVYVYAKAGLGDYMDFSSAWGYWISAWLGNVGYFVLLFSTLGDFVPAFGQGNTPLAIVCASGVLWCVHVLVLRGIKEAALINLITTVAKLVPILLFIVIVGLAVSLLGALLQWALLCAEILFVCAKDGTMPAFLRRESAHQVPVNALWLANGMIQLFLLITLFSQGTYLSLIYLASSMILVPYLWSAVYALLLALCSETYEDLAGLRRKDLAIGLLAVGYAIWLLYAGGVKYLMLSALLCASGALLFRQAKCEQGKVLFTRYEWPIFAAVLLTAAVGRLRPVCRATEFVALDKAASAWIIRPIAL